ncbi:MAG: hypothetical protein H0W83_02165 [Planctomycetes bacterium]|nr:hypothetical protein [Planctomycetota bacterium]
MRPFAVIACMATLIAVNAQEAPPVIDPVPAPVPVEPTPSLEPLEPPTAVQPTLDGPRERPHPRHLDSEEEFVLLYGLIGAGTEKRFDGVLIGRRDEGELIDGEAGLQCRRDDHEGTQLTVRAVSVSVGTDRISPREGCFEADGSYAEQRWRGHFPLYRVEVGAGYSRDRKLLLAGDVVAGLLHLGIARDDIVRTYRIGGCLLGRPEMSAFRLTIDRVIGYVDGQRYLATEARLRIPWRLNRTLFLYGEGAHLRHGLDGSGTTTAWEGWFGVGVVW